MYLIFVQITYEYIVRVGISHCCSIEFRFKGLTGFAAAGHQECSVKGFHLLVRAHIRAKNMSAEAAVQS